MPAWGKKQTDDWDRLSNFVYELPSYEQFLDKIAALNFPAAFNDYAIHRWYNVLSASGVEQIFCDNNFVIPHKNKRDKLVDFSIHGIDFDHKTTVFPRGFNKQYSEAKSNPADLIKWLYAAQSKEGRYHTANRLFIVLHHSEGRHWQLRRELSLLKPIIDRYVQDFCAEKLFCLDLIPGQTTYADIIWFEQ